MLPACLAAKTLVEIKAWSDEVKATLGKRRKVFDFRSERSFETSCKKGDFCVGFAGSKFSCITSPRSSSRVSAQTAPAFAPWFPN
jgi:hypothetical protein